MKRFRVLMLEDEQSRVERFSQVLASLNSNLELTIWDTAPAMITEAPAFFPETVFISLDHDLYPEDVSEPGDGLDVANFLSRQDPVCPVIVHTSNSPRAV
jgi:CheY-like chemotaxis protein